MEVFIKIFKKLFLVLTLVTIVNMSEVGASSIKIVDFITNLHVPKLRGSNVTSEKTLLDSDMRRHHKLRNINASKPLDVRVIKYGSATGTWMGSTWYDIHNKTSRTLTMNTYSDLPFYMQGGRFKLEFRTRLWEVFDAKVNNAEWYLQA